MRSVLSRTIVAVSVLGGLSACAVGGNSPTDPVGLAPSQISAPTVTAAITSANAPASLPQVQSLDAVNTLLGDELDVVLSGATVPVGVSADPAPGSGSATAAGANGLTLPTSVVGKLFAWDTTLKRYAPVANPTGVPANGVRVQLYTLGSNQKPVLPLQPTGVLDIVGTTVNNLPALRVTVTKTGETTASLDFTATSGVVTTSPTSFPLPTPTAVQYGAKGTATPTGQDAVTFDFQRIYAIATVQNASEGRQRLQVNYLFTVPAKNFSYRLEQDLSGNGEKARGQLKVTSTTGQTVLVATGTWADTGMVITVTRNGTAFATITRKGDDDAVKVTVTGANGTTLTDADKAALDLLVKQGEQVHQFAERLGRPLEMVLKAVKDGARTGQAPRQAPPPPPSAFTVTVTRTQGQPPVYSWTGGPASLLYVAGSIATPTSSSSSDATQIVWGIKRTGEGAQSGPAIPSPVTHGVVPTGGPFDTKTGPALVAGKKYVVYVIIPGTNGGSISVGRAEFTY